MSAASTYKLSVQVSDFEDIRPLIQLARLLCDFCSSGQRFACGFLQIPSRDGHPCRPANDSPCRVRRRLSLPSECALPGARKRNPLATASGSVSAMNRWAIFVRLYRPGTLRAQSRRATLAKRENRPAKAYCPAMIPIGEEDSFQRVHRATWFI